MKNIELYDIITLDNDEEYTVLKIINENNRKFYLLAWIDEEEEPNTDRIKIVEETTNNNELCIQEIKDESLLKKLSQKFLTAFKGPIE